MNGAMNAKIEGQAMPRQGRNRKATKPHLFPLGPERGEVEWTAWIVGDAMMNSTTTPVST